MIESSHHLIEEQEIQYYNNENALPKLDRQEGSICCLTNLMQRYSDSQISFLYTLSSPLSGAILIPIKVLKDELEKSNEVKERYFTHMAAELIILRPEKFTLLNDYRADWIKILIERHTEVRILKPGETMNTKNACILVNGSVHVEECYADDNKDEHNSSSPPISNISMIRMSDMEIGTANDSVTNFFDNPETNRSGVTEKKCSCELYDFALIQPTETDKHFRALHDGLADETVILIANKELNRIIGF